MFSRVERMLIALMFALLAAGITLIAAQAQEDGPTAQIPNPTLNCAACHADFQTTWMRQAISGMLACPARGGCATWGWWIIAWRTRNMPGAR